MIDRRGFFKLLGGVAAFVTAGRSQSRFVGRKGRYLGAEIVTDLAPRTLDSPVRLWSADPHDAYGRAIGDALADQMDREMTHAQGFHDWLEKG